MVSGAHPPRPPSDRRRATGLVRQFLEHGRRALVELPDGATVTATDALLPADIPLLAALVVGAPVTGILEGSELHPEPLEPDLAVFPHGCHALALVVTVSDTRATAQLHPRISAVLRRRDVDTGDSPIGDVLSVGEVIRVRVTRMPGKPPALSRTDAIAHAPLVPAPPLVAGGPPWLQETDAAADRPEPTPVIPTTADEDYATRADVAALSHEITRLRADLLALTDLVEAGSAPEGESELERLRRENEQLRAVLAERTERTHLSGSIDSVGLTGQAVPLPTAVSPTNTLPTTAEQTGTALRAARRAAERSHVDTTADGIRFEIERTWGNRTSPGERQRWPLRSYVLGPDFVASVSPLDDAQLGKAIRTCVDAITGRDREIPARNPHRLRTGEGGRDAYVVRQDGARCMRSSVEQDVAGARRLHYWELADGGIELGRIVAHDDTRP